MSSTNVAKSKRYLATFRVPTEQGARFLYLGFAADSASEARDHAAHCLTDSSTFPKGAVVDGVGRFPDLDPGKMGRFAPTVREICVEA